MIEVRIVERSGVPVVAVNTDSGGPLTGHVDGHEPWVVVDDHPGFEVVDPFAPLGGAVVYENSAGETTTVAVVSRVADSIGTVDSQIVATGVRGPERSRDWGLATVLRPRNSAKAWVAYPRVFQAGQEPFIFATSSVQSRNVERLLEAPRDVVIRHNLALCRMPGCTVPPARLVALEGLSGSTAGFTHDSEWTDWKFAVADVDPAVVRGSADSGGVVALSDWGDVARRFTDWGQAVQSDWGQLARGEF